MRGAWLLGMVLVTACSSRGLVPCSTQAECAPYQAVCLEGLCRLPEGLDLGGLDLADPPAPDLSVEADLSAEDLAQGPDLALSCAAGEACPIERPVCGADQICRTCVAADRPVCAAASILAPRCDEASGQCAACRPGAYELADCPGIDFPVCSSDGSCRQACDENSHCPSGLCDEQIVTRTRRSCARADEIVYVKATASCSGAHAGTEADPRCTLDDAMAALPNGGFIRVLHDGAPLDRIRTPITRPYVIVAVVPTAPVIVAASEWIGGVLVHPHAAEVKAGGRLHLEGIRVQDAAGGAFTCDATGGDAQIRLRDVDIANSKDAAVRSKDCAIKLERVRIRESQDGVVHDGGLLRMSNTYIYRNVGTAVRTSATSNFDLAAHLTIADNVPTNPNQVGGFVCGLGGIITNSIVWGNRAVGGAMYSGGCVFRYSSVDPAVAGNGNNHIAPVFTPANIAAGTPSDYHLEGPLPAGVNPCCIDVGENLLGAVRDDWDRQVRQSPPDVGADEVL